MQKNLCGPLAVIAILISGVQLCAMSNLKALQKELWDAIGSDNAEKVEQILKSGSSYPMLQGIYDKYGRTPFVKAVDEAHYWAARKMLDKAYNTLKISSKACLVSFTQYEHQPYTTNLGVLDALEQRIPSIVTIRLLRRQLVNWGYLQNMLRSKQWTLFFNASNDLAIIIPAPVESAEELHKQYGFRNSRLIDINNIETEFTNLPGAYDVTTLILHLGDLIDLSNEQYPTRWLLIGHGLTDLEIANIPLKLMKQFLKLLSDLQSEFLFISTCYAFGPNMLVIQNQINELIDELTKQKKKGFYAIAIKATSDVKTYGNIANLNLFFTRLNKYLEGNDFPWDMEKSHHVLPTLKKDLEKVSLKDIFSVIGEDPAILPSIRFPYKRDFFRPIKLESTEVVTISKLVESRVSQSLKNIRPEIMINIKPNTDYIQILPSNLTDCVFNIEGLNIPKFISKMAGPSFHCIKRVNYTSSVTEPEKALIDFCQEAFIHVFVGQMGLEWGSTPKCWIIRELQFKIAHKPVSFFNVTIYVEPTLSEDKTSLLVRLLYKEDQRSTIYKLYSIKADIAGKNVGSATPQLKLDRLLSAQESVKILSDCIIKTIPSEQALMEATGGHETMYSLLETVSSCLGVDIALLIPADKITPELIKTIEDANRVETLLDKYLSRHGRQDEVVNDLLKQTVIDNEYERLKAIFAGSIRYYLATQLANRSIRFAIDLDNYDIMKKILDDGWLDYPKILAPLLEYAVKSDRRPAVSEILNYFTQHFKENIKDLNIKDLVEWAKQNNRQWFIQLLTELKFII